MRRTTVVIISPTYNEVDNVESLVRALKPIFAKLREYDCHLLFVDDNSPDGTGKKIIALARKYAWVHLLSNREKGGLGHAYKKGMRYSLDKLKADIVFEFDADLSHDPDKIPTMLTRLKQGADMVLGSRYIKGGGIPADWGFHRKFLSVVGNLFLQTVMFNFRLRDWTTGYRAIKRQVVEQIVPQLGSERFTGYTWQIGFLVKTIQGGFSISEVPFIFKDRTLGHSKLGPEYIINNLVFIMKLRLQDLIHHRVFKFAVTGGLGALVQFTALHFYRQSLPFQLAFFLAIETAVVGNFTLNNFWTFRDRKLKIWQVPLKFIQFNMASGGSILIQQTVAFLGENLIGLYTLFTIPGTAYTLDTGAMFAVAGILIGMFWNFFAYNHFIWKKK